MSIAVNEWGSFTVLSTAYKLYDEKTLDRQCLIDGGGGGGGIRIYGMEGMHVE